MTLEETIKHLDDPHVHEIVLEPNQLSVWLRELKKAKDIILDTSYTLVVMCGKISTQLDCERCPYYNEEEPHKCGVKVWIDKIQTFAKSIT